ncbi:unnamed protein product [Trichogramma brassicae]|uniref:Uncharacterized protein n=1 Tax=Trichogramma brassicae TaxID=86971 RepID=A0A6H5J128_9HYME|nr:unnamed protein product [Trichogramma brassicae]
MAGQALYPQCSKPYEGSPVLGLAYCCLIQGKCLTVSQTKTAATKILCKPVTCSPSATARPCRTGDNNNEKSSCEGSQESRLEVYAASESYILHIYLVIVCERCDTPRHNSAENPIGMRIGGPARARQRECRGGGAPLDAWRRGSNALDINRAIPRQQQHFVEFLCESFNLTHYCPAGQVFQEYILTTTTTKNSTRERSSRCRGCKIFFYNFCSPTPSGAAHIYKQRRALALLSRLESAREPRRGRRREERREKKPRARREHGSALQQVASTGTYLDGLQPHGQTKILRACVEMLHKMREGAIVNQLIYDDTHFSIKKLDRARFCCYVYTFVYYIEAQ